MFKIFSNIPIFVWPLLAILVIGGLKARKVSLVPLKTLMLIPAGFFVWALTSFFNRYGENPLAIFLWILCLGIGFYIGFSHVQRLELRFDKEKKTVEMPGSWIPLVLSMSIFTAKFSIGMLRGMMPSMEGSIVLVGLELFSGIILGVFSGRAASCFYRYSSFRKEDCCK